jgi:hypothetical protein
MVRRDTGGRHLTLAASVAPATVDVSSARFHRCIRGPRSRFSVPGGLWRCLVHASTWVKRVCNLVVRANIAVLAIVPLRLPLEAHESTRNPAAIHHQPLFITAPGETDVLLVVMALVLVAAVLSVGVFFFWLHSLPERLVHNSTKAHFDIVAALALLSLFTHIHLFWVAALVIALIRIPIPDFTGVLNRIARSLERIAAAPPRKSGAALPGNANASLSNSSERPVQGA